MKEIKLAENVSKPKKDDRGKRKDTKKKPNAVVRYWRSTVGELRKVSWPTTQEAFRLTKIVIFVVLAMAFVLGLLDIVFQRLIALIV